ncbi:histidine--tRNA ligase [Bradyrhizobium sp. Leo170]|nr:HisS family protein [Bradyrhizobium sp. Leo170]TAI60614.1 histidine--tRNA ligase [Bradyrhizobium sp. Leo170]
MADKPKKPQKLKARLPRGLEDRGPTAIAATRRMTETIREVFERYGFEPVETPAMEYTDALGKFLPDQDRPNEGVFSFQDDDEQWISLRYDLTAPLARYVAENFDHLPKPYRSYRAGYVFRNEKPGPGRFRQFMQFDADTVGSASPAADAEMCMMAADTMEALGIPRGSYVVKVNNRKVLDGVMESIGLGGEENAEKRLTVLRAIDKLDRLRYDGVRQLLGEGRKDESGDFTKGAGLDETQIASILGYAIPSDYYLSTDAPHNQMSRPDVPIWRLVREGGSIPDDRLHSVPENPDDQMFCDIAAYIERMREFVGSSQIGREGVDELLAINSLVRSAGYGTNRIEISASVVRGLEYYTGPVYEVELMLETKDEKGRPVRFGSVGGGGRYDGLVSRFRGEPVPATGFSIGVSRLQAALTLLGKLDTRPQFGPVVVTVFDRERVADYQKMVAQLRSANIRAELYLGNPKNMGNQLKYADRRNSPCVIIQGSDEKARSEVQIKDLIEGAKAAAAIASNQEWRETRPAQFSCAEADLVAKVREVLARHEVTWG